MRTACPLRAARRPLIPTPAPHRLGGHAPHGADAPGRPVLHSNGGCRDSQRAARAAPDPRSPPPLPNVARLSVGFPQRSHSRPPPVGRDPPWPSVRRSASTRRRRPPRARADRAGAPAPGGCPGRRGQPTGTDRTGTSVTSLGGETSRRQLRRCRRRDRRQRQTASTAAKGRRLRGGKRHCQAARCKAAARGARLDVGDAFFGGLAARGSASASVVAAVASATAVHGVADGAPTGGGAARDGSGGG